MRAALGAVAQAMFHLPIPLTEEIFRPLTLSLWRADFLQLLGKRELAELNPFNRVLLLNFSNTVQNPIIGEGNSAAGRTLRASSSLARNCLMPNGLHPGFRLNAALEGLSAVLVRDREVEHAALGDEKLRMEELISAVGGNGLRDRPQVASPDERQHRELTDTPLQLAGGGDALGLNGAQPA